MNIGIHTWGSEGNVRLFLALAAGLRAAGYDVTLAVTHVTNRTLPRSALRSGRPSRSRSPEAGGRGPGPGNAPPLLHRRPITAAKLARAIRTAIDSPSIREEANMIEECMRNENGATRAVELIGEQSWI